MASVYYLTIWFRAAQAQSATKAGIRTIPMLLSQVFMGIFAAIFTQKAGYYVPAMLLSPVLFAVGVGMLSILTPSTGSSEWIGYQIIYGLGTGAGFQTSNLPPQNVLPRADVHGADVFHAAARRCCVSLRRPKHLYHPISC